jgi:hypothetical protein
MRAPDLLCRPLIVSPPLPIINPTFSFGTGISICSETPAECPAAGPLAPKEAEPPASASDITAFIRTSAFSILAKSPIISTGLVLACGSASESLVI